MLPIITLTTDFGLADEYVGVLKGVILAQAGDVHLVDLCHTIPPQDVRRAALLLAASYAYFPPKTLHVVVVDPGVGSARRILLARAAGQMFLAPDNGVLTPLLADGVLESVHSVTNRELFLPAVSATFHGRDIFAPVAARLVRGLAPEAAGPRLDPAAPLRLPGRGADVNREERRISGQVVAVDHFGNLITDIAGQVVLELMEGGRFCPVFHIGGLVVEGLAASYASAGTGQLLALIGSGNAVEIASNLGDAAKTLKAGVDAPVTVSFR